MARLARVELFDPSEIAAVHVMAKTVRHCWLLGLDERTGKNFDHRKLWIEDKLQALAANFGIDLLAFACMSNHFHLVLRSRPDVVGTWDDTEVARRWWTLCPKRKVIREVMGQEIFFPADPTEWELNSIRNDPVKLAQIRRRLSDVSWWMRLLCQYIAMRANKEEGTKVSGGLGHFWQGRYKAVRLLDEESLLACAAYVDLNPIRAAIAETIEDSQHTSVKRRVSALQTEVANNVSEDISPIDRSVDAPDCFLSPVSVDERNDPLGPRPSRSGKRCSDKGFIALADAEYLEILDWLARSTLSSKRGSTPEHAPKVFERLCIDPVVWAEMVKNFGRKFKSVAGNAKSIESARTRKSRRRFYCARV